MTQTHDKARIRSFFDGDTWQRRYCAGGMEEAVYRDRLRAAVALLDKHGRPGGLVLDAGAGAGQLSVLLERDYTVVSSDLAFKMAERARHARQRGPGVVVADVEQPPFRPRSFDAIMLLGVVSYLADAEAALRGLRELIRPRGVLIVSSANTCLLFERLGQKLFRVPGLRAAERSAEDDEARDRRFLREQCTYYRTRRFNNLVCRQGYRLLDNVSVGFGQIRLRGRPLLPQRCGLGLSRLTSRAARARPLSFLNDYAFMNIACFGVD